MFSYDQDWKKSEPPTGITESTWQSFNTLPEKEDHCSGVNKRTGLYDCSICGVIVTGRKGWLYTISWWNEHKRSESQNQKLEWKFQAMALKLNIKQKDGSATRFDGIQAKQMGNTQIPLKLFFIKKTTIAPISSNAPTRRLIAAESPSLDVVDITENTASSSSTEILPSRGSCFGIFMNLRQPLFWNKLDAYISNAAVSSTALHIAGVVGPFSQGIQRY